MQFEETWATLLGVLVTQPVVMDQEENQQEVKLSKKLFYFGIHSLTFTCAIHTAQQYLPSVSSLCCIGLLHF